MTTFVDKEIKARARAELRSQLEAAVADANKAIQDIKNYCDETGKDVPFWCDTVYVVRVNKKGGLIISSNRDHNAISLADLENNHELYSRILADKIKSDQDEREIQRIEQMIVAAVGEEKWRWYQQKTNPY